MTAATATLALATKIATRYIRPLLMGNIYYNGFNILSYFRNYNNYI
jgi:hypothetical protein